MKKDGTLKSISEKWLGMNVSVPNNQENSNNIIDNNKNNSIGFDFMYSLDLIPMLLKAINVTISLSVFGMILGLIVGITLAMIRVYKIPVLKQIAEVYISFFRGTPLLVQLFLLYLVCHR